MFGLSISIKFIASSSCNILIKAKSLYGATLCLLFLIHRVISVRLDSLTPLLHVLHEVVDLRIAHVLKHMNGFNRALLILGTRDKQLEDPDSCTALALLELRVSIEELQHIESLRRELEQAHFVAIISNQIQKGQTLI